VVVAECQVERRGAVVKR